VQQEIWGAMPTVDSVIAIYDTHEQAEQVVKALQEVGVDITNLSIAAKNTHEYVVRLLQRWRSNQLPEKDRSYLGWILASAIPICGVCQTLHRVDPHGASSCCIEPRKVLKEPFSSQGPVRLK
jgi:hypothetical protein